MKTNLITLTTLLLSVFCMAQNDEAENKLNECKRYTIQVLKGENQQENLSNCLVSLAMLGSDYTDKYTAWSSEVVANTQDELESQLEDLEVESEIAAEQRTQSFNNIIDSVNTTIQQSSSTNSSTNTNSGYHCDDCPEGTQR